MRLSTLEAKLNTVLVTGCAGFIASQVCQQLLERGDWVVGIDNLNDYYDVSLKHHRLNQLRQHPRFTFQQIDIEQRSAAGGIIPGALVFRSAEPGSPRRRAVQHGEPVRVHDDERHGQP